MTDVNPNRWGGTNDQPARGGGSPALKGGEEVSTVVQDLPLAASSE